MHLIAFLITGVVIGVKPWWKPQYFIPLAGMLIGNSMNAVAISLDRLLGELKKRRQEVEMMLCLGADYREASKDMVGNAMRAGMIPAINSMMAAGVVFIPGMMTGQILAGGRSRPGNPLSDPGDGHARGRYGHAVFFGGAHCLQTLLWPGTTASAEAGEEIGLTVNHHGDTSWALKS